MPRYATIKAKITEYLRDHDKARAAIIAVAINEPPRQVSYALKEMVAKCEVWPVDRASRKAQYSLNRPARKNISPRYVPEFRPMTEADYDIRSHMRMALVGR